jgi:hypothetical protein
MAYKLVKKYPDNFSKDITNIVNDLTFKHGEKPFLYGSGSYKINYPSDYDLAQEIPVNKYILLDFQEVIRKILKRKDVYIGDIKCGEIPELKIIDDDLNENNYNMKLSEMRNKLKKLYTNKNIDKDEYNESLKLLKPNLSEFNIYVLKHEIRYEVMRWKAQDILNGYVNYRGYKINFYDYLLGDTLTKIDIIAWVNGIRYNEITMVYVFTKNNKPINTKFGNIILDLISQIPYLLFEGKYMKICKRINSIERASKTPNNYILDILNKLFNSNLGRLNQILSDITALEFLIENIKTLSKEKFNFEIDQIKYRLGNMTNRKYLEHEDKVIKLINIIENDTFDLDALENLKLELFNILESETLKFMKKNGLFPISNKYLPANLKSINEENTNINISRDYNFSYPYNNSRIVGDGFIDTLTKAVNYISNMFPSSDMNATIIEPDEKHGVLILPNGKIGRANYMGPGTNLIKRLKRGDKPRTEMDELSRAHDIRYDLAQSQKDIEDADEIFIKGAKKIRKNKLDNKINTYVGQIPIQAKLYAERKGLVKPTFKQINKFEKDDEKLLRDTLKTAIMKGYGIPSNKKLYETIKKQVFAKYPKHSAYRSMLLVKEYKKAGGKYYDDKMKTNKMNIKKWLGQKWTSLNDYHHNNTIVKCGNSNTKEKFNEYPVCRPLSIIKKLSHPQMQKLIDEKNTVSGMGQDKITMSKKNLLKEHQHLIKVLKSGNKKEQIKEAISQQKEIEKYCDCPAPKTGYGECGKIPYKF